MPSLFDVALRGIQTGLQLLRRAEAHRAGEVVTSSTACGARSWPNRFLELPKGDWHSQGRGAHLRLSARFDGPTHLLIKQGLDRIDRLRARW